ncbi:MAG: NUDIX domain-containing protein [Nitrincola lacisaponensis]|uniref:NUDIX domain-containing protein n=1 Tax=Nitrincola lacisaponensis TaxID=267850 RepID=UPI00391C9335
MSLWKPTFSAADVQVEEDRCVFQGFFRMHELRIRHARFQGGDLTVTREMFRRGDAVAVLLFDPRKEALVLIEQFRPGALAAPGGPWLLELVAGMIEADETPEGVAERETLEEAGLHVTGLQPILGYLPSPGGMDEWIHLLYGFVDASNAEGLQGLADEGEDIRVHCLPVADVFELLRKGQLNNAAILIAVQWLQLNYTAIHQQGFQLVQHEDET